MRVESEKYIYFVILLFALDSLLKVSVGPVNLLLPVLLVAIVVPFLNHTSNDLRLFLKGNFFIVAYILYSLLDIFRAGNVAVFAKILSHLLVFLLIYYVCFYYVRRWGWEKLSFSFVCLLLIGGYLQYILYKGAGVQLTLAGLDSHYYIEGGSIQDRMRGFFLEPNWYGLSVFMAFCVYFPMAKSIGLRRCVTGLVFLALLLSNNRIVLALFLAYLAVFYFPSIDRRIKAWSVVFGLSLLGIGLLFLLTGSFDESLDRSLAARSVSYARAYDYLLYSGNLIFGNGFSNWGDYSNLLGLGKLNLLQEQSLTSRDTGEFHVILFEQGVIGICLLLADSIYLVYIAMFNRSGSSDYLLACLFVIMSFVIVSMFYPVFTFVQYLIAYMLARSIVIISHLSGEKVTRYD